MMRSAASILIFFFSLSIQGFSQENCKVIFDDERILENTDLDHFLSKLKEEKFTVYKKKEHVPAFIMDQLDCITKGFSLANPNEDYACCCVSSSHLPKRKMVYLASSNDVLVMMYLTGGFGVETHLLMIEFAGEKIEKLWVGFGDEKHKSPRGIVSFINKERNKKSGLHTNIVYL